MIVDLYGKGGHIRTVPVPGWVKTAIDCWTTAAQVTSGRIFRCVSRTGSVWGDSITEKVVWCVVKEFASKAQLGSLAPHDLRRYAVYRAMPNEEVSPESVRSLGSGDSA